MLKRELGIQERITFSAANPMIFFLNTPIKNSKYQSDTDYSLSF